MRCTLIWQYFQTTGLSAHPRRRGGRSCASARAVWPDDHAGGVGEGIETGFKHLAEKEQGRDFTDFEWQGGYADFSVCQSNLEQVRRYIAGQEEHHRKVSFQDEFREFLKRYAVEFDERYVWG